MTPTERLATPPSCCRQNAPSDETARGGPCCRTSARRGRKRRAGGSVVPFRTFARLRPAALNASLFPLFCLVLSAASQILLLPFGLYKEPRWVSLGLE